jgi:hypothetical protein
MAVDPWEELERWTRRKDSDGILDATSPSVALGLTLPCVHAIPIPIAAAILLTAAAVRANHMMHLRVALQSALLRQ